MRWLRLQWFALLAGLRLWADQPFSHLLNALVLSIALALPWTLFQGLSALVPSMDRWVGDPEVSVFFKPRTDETTVDSVEAVIQRDFGVNDVKKITPDQAAAQMKAQSRSPDLIDALPSNPLPYTLIVRLRVEADKTLDIDSLVAAWQALPGVEHVQFDAQWMRRLQSVLNSLRWLALGLATVIGLMVVIVTFNTVRLQLVSHRQEVMVLKALGATDTEVGRPTLWWAMSLAVVAFLLAYGGVFGAMQACDEAVGLWVRQFDMDFAFLPPSGLTVLALAVCWAALVMIGAWASVRKTVWTMR
jgi:cell division transport system permease protein